MERSPFTGRARIILALSAVVGCGIVEATSEKAVHVAVTHSFLPLHGWIAAEFERVNGIQVVTTSGTSEQLCAQIQNGAPVDVFLSDDEEHPRLLEESGLAVAGSRFPYATGELVLHVPNRFVGEDPRAFLCDPDLRTFAIAAADTTHYGLAAQETIEHMDLWSTLEPKLLRGENLEQTLELVENGMADGGFVARYQLVELGVDPDWIVPEDLHTPLRQEAILLNRGRENPEASAFLEFIREEWARNAIKTAGYGVSP